MRLYMMENDSSDYLEIPDGIEDYDPDSSYRMSFVEKAVEFIKSRSNKFLNEFYTNNIKVFRGEDGLTTDSIMIRKTREKRDKTYGTIASDDDFREQLNRYFGQQGIARRDEHVVFTTTQNPDNFKGISVDAWFYIFPIGEYNYSYSKGSSGHGDINLSQDIITKDLNQINRFFRDTNGLIKNRFLRNLESMRKPIDDLNHRIVEANNEHGIIDRETLDKYIKTFNENFDYILKYLGDLVSNSTNLQYLIDNGFKDIRKTAETITTKYIDNCINSYQNISDEFIEYDDSFEEKDTILNQIKSVLYELRPLGLELEIAFIENDKLKKALENFKENIEENIITNSIDDGIENNELWFNTKSYILLPYNIIGEQIVNHLEQTY